MISLDIQLINTVACDGVLRGEAMGGRMHIHISLEGCEFTLHDASRCSGRCGA